MKRILGRLAVTVLVLCAIFGTTLTVSAQIPYNSYTYWNNIGSDGKSVYNRQMYDAVSAVGADEIGVGPFTKINDICTDKDGNIYILDSTSRIVITDKNCKLIREIGQIDGESYDEASGIYAHSDGTLYISDTSGHRVLHIDAEGRLIEEILIPKSSLIPDDFDFRPTAVAIDSHNYLYVVSNGSYYGALLYAPDKSFLGFYGANTVKASVSDVITNVMNRLMPNNEKKSNTAQRLPYCFVNIKIDNEDYVYTCNGYTETYSRKGQIRRLSPGTGSNILGTGSQNFVDVKINRTYNSGGVSKQDILDVEVDSRNFVYGLESAFGKVFMYSPDGDILTVFGGGMGYGSQVGNFVKVSAMALLDDGEQIAVADSSTGLITFFKITDFGKSIKELITLTNAGKYAQAKGGWETVLKEDNNFQQAYSGLARAYLDEGNYTKSMELAKKGYDRDTYSVAFEYYRKNFINDHFILLFVLLIAVIVGVCVFLVITTKKKVVLIKNKELRLMFTTAIHPTNSFAEIKEKHAGSITLGIVTIILFYVATVLQTLAGGFMFSTYDAESFNSLWVFVRSVGLVILWIAANWLVCTLLGGKGKIKEIFLVTSYSLWPLIIEKFLRLILTNVLLPSEASFLGILDTIALIYFVLLMIIGLLRIHDFSMTALLGTSILTMAGIAAIIFLIIMVSILVQQFWGFIITLASELMTL